MAKRIDNFEHTQSAADIEKQENHTALVSFVINSITCARDFISDPVNKINEIVYGEKQAEAIIEHRPPSASK